MGESAISAKNSAEADAARYKDVGKGRHFPHQSNLHKES